jgi:hypothetical protein
MMTGWQTAGIETTTWICQDCGQEVECGLMNACDHWSACKKDAPNCDIGSHRFEVAYKKERKKYDDMLSVLWEKMTPEERQTDFINSMSGIWDQQSNTMLMGSEAIHRMDEFRREMRTKYGL